ncbi:LmeA family phospholipid-binding protein [Gordonia malaquae]|uniref:LmeA family phospholipid-binding protein n=1 Tax=Gordonia malaquae TaxID=410332 RepID=UPI0030FE0A79
MTDDSTPSGDTPDNSPPVEDAAAATPSADPAQPEPAGPAESTDAADDTPTGEVITGPIDPTRRPAEPATHAYSQASRPPTRQMEALGTGAFDAPSNPGIPVASSSPEIPVTKSAPAANKHGRRRTIALISAAVVLLLVIAGVGSELYMRSKVTDCISNAFGGLTGASTDVSVSRKPMLLAVFGSEVPWVQVDTNDGDAADMRLHARAEGISTDGGTVRSLKGSGYLPYKRITELSNESQQSGGATIKSISADANAGTIKLETEVPIAILSIPATVTLKPTVTNGTVKFEVKDATALMFGLPSDFAQPIVDQVTTSMFGPLFKQIKVSDLKVTGSGIDFAFAGSDVNLKAASEGQSAAGESSGSCSI